MLLVNIILPIHANRPITGSLENSIMQGSEGHWKTALCKDQRDIGKQHYHYARLTGTLENSIMQGSQGYWKTA